MKEFTNDKQRDARVTAQQLRDVFNTRLNPPKIMPPHFDADLKRLRDLMSEAIPPTTTDHTAEQFFSRPWDLSDIEQMKRKIRNRSSKSARGIDQCSYKKIQSIPNAVLLKLFNYCTISTKCSGDGDTRFFLMCLKIAIIQMKIYRSPRSTKI
jgi:hypothetical protein